jgi:hypothetical protein
MVDIGLSAFSLFFMQSESFLSYQQRLPRIPRVPQMVGSPRHTIAHTMAPRGPIISQKRFTIPTLRNLSLLVITPSHR